MSAQSILVTGAAGFIGFHISKALLDAGKTVVGIDNMNDYYDVQLKQDRVNLLDAYEGFSFIKMDIADRPAMEGLWSSSGPFTNVIHMAAQAGVRYSIENPYAYIHSNVLGHLTVMEMCRHTKDFEHLVYASSSSVYGGNKKLPYAVDDPVTCPVSLYAATKRSDELMSHTYSHLYDLPQTGLRFFTVYGPWGRPDMSPIIFAKAIKEGRKVPVFNYGEMKRDFTYIDDIVAGVLSLLDKPPARVGEEVPHRILNIGNSKSENLMDFIREIEKNIGKQADLDLQPFQPGDVLETYADISQTSELSGYSPKTSIDEGVHSFVSWYNEYYGSK